MTDIATAIVWLAGSAFALLAAVGVLRMPDVFTRMQASTKASTLGLACLLIGAALQMGDFASLIRVASIGAFVLLTTPVAAHVIARAAYFGVQADFSVRMRKACTRTTFSLADEAWASVSSSSLPRRSRTQRACALRNASPSFSMLATIGFRSAIASAPPRSAS